MKTAIKKIKPYIFADKVEYNYIERKIVPSDCFLDHDYNSKISLDFYNPDYALSPYRLCMGKGVVNLRALCWQDWETSSWRRCYKLLGRPDLINEIGSNVDEKVLSPVMHQPYTFVFRKSIKYNHVGVRETANKVAVIDLPSGFYTKAKEYSTLVCPPKYIMVYLMYRNLEVLFQALSEIGLIEQQVTSGWPTNIGEKELEEIYNFCC